MKKQLFILLLMPFLANCHSSEKIQQNKTGATNHENDARVEKIVLHHVDWGILTITNVSCDDFDNCFSLCMKKDTITDTIQIAILENYINNFKEIKSVASGMDTRAKIYLMSSIDTIEYCINYGLAYSNDIFYEVPEDFVKYIDSCKQ